MSARTLAGLAVPLLLALGACSEAARDRAVDDAVGEVEDRARAEVEERLPSVDWRRYRDGAQEEIDRAAAAADCDRLSEELEQVGSEGSAVRDYIEAKLREAGC